ncbi:AmmeMemoRadiSam system protein B [bacterium]|nr:AmmeMemoRadiSam system protein B [bacterium]
MTDVRRAAVAGAFYMEDPEALSAEIASLMDKEAAEGPRPKALIVPHAGYVYSGPVAARAYARVRKYAAGISRVLLLGPTHHQAVAGMALPSVKAFQTPLGDIPLDMSSIARMTGRPEMQISKLVHENEHSIEVQLPFLQTLLHDFTLLPVLVGDADPSMVEALLHEFGRGEETLIVVSSDLSHFLNYDEARKLDEATRKAIESLDTEGWTWKSACGRIPILGLLRLARRLNMKVETLDLRNSGDTAGGRERVVGYGAWAFHESEDSA